MLTVSEQTLAMTTHCQNHFHCLSGQVGGPCKVVFTLESVPFLRINNKNVEPCAYSFRFGDSDFCTCPVRRELFERYRI